MSEDVSDRPVIAMARFVEPVFESVSDLRFVCRERNELVDGGANCGFVWVI
jgi:hypothetical protein